MIKLPAPEDVLPTPVRPVAPVLPPFVFVVPVRIPTTLRVPGLRGLIILMLMPGERRQGAADQHHRGHRQNQNQALYYCAVNLPPATVQLPCPQQPTLRYTWRAGARITTLTMVDYPTA